jgi:hypothetical protein
MFHLGLAYDYDDRIFEYMTLGHDGEGRVRAALNLIKSDKPRPDVVSMILEILGLRYMLSESVLFHHAKDAHSAMLSRALLESRFIVDLLNARRPKNNILREYMAKPGSQVRSYWDDPEQPSGIEVQEMLALGDDELIAKLAADQDDCAATLGHMLEGRQLYSLVMTISYADAQRCHAQDEIIDVTHRSPAFRHALERQIEDELSMPRGSVLFYTPSAEMNVKLAQVHVLAGEKAVPLDDHEKRSANALTDGFLQAQIARFHRLWRSYVFVHPEIRPEQRELVEEYVKGRFALAANTGNPAQRRKAQDRSYRSIAQRLLAASDPTVPVGELERVARAEIRFREEDHARPVSARLEVMRAALNARRAP